ncbi:MAG: hypothetical protein KF773_41670 [Deltaproteobacteria bacterium]|nr:hypothetical protein [Deltaproteobacteria bacterium]MCW5806488.1 hypothetical protein [Deltaproteobacteria bacterium]
MYQWLLVGHLIGVILWIGCMAATYWMLRFHTQAPKAVHEKLILMERSLALAMDLGAALAIGCGLGMALSSGGGESGSFQSQFTHPVGNLFAAKGGLSSPGWFHIKLLVVVLGVLSIHGMLRARVAKFSRGESPTVPQWMWSVLLVSVVAIIILVIRGPFMFARKADDKPAQPSSQIELVVPTDLHG